MHKKKYVFALPLLAVLLSTAFYIAFITPFNNYGLSNNRFLNILDIYENIEPNSIIFLGDSQVREDIDCAIINNKTCFNLGIAGILPLQLALQKDMLIKTKPKKLIFGISPLLFNEDANINKDIFFFINEKKRISIDKPILTRLNPDEKDLLFMGKIDRLLYKKKFILPFYVGLLKPASSQLDIATNFKNPGLFIEKQDKDEINKKLNDPEIIRLFDISNSSKRQRESFVYLLNELTKQNMGIIFIQMPLHPAILRKIDSKSQASYHNYIRKLSSAFNITLIDIEQEFDEQYFNDLTHLNANGRYIISKKIARGDYNII